MFYNGQYFNFAKKIRTETRQLQKNNRHSIAPEFLSTVFIRVEDRLINPVRHFWGHFLRKKSYIQIIL